METLKGPYFTFPTFTFLLVKLMEASVERVRFREHFYRSRALKRGAETEFF